MSHFLKRFARFTACFVFCLAAILLLRFLLLRFYATSHPIGYFSLPQVHQLSYKTDRIAINSLVRLVSNKDAIDCMSYPPLAIQGEYSVSIPSVYGFLDPSDFPKTPIVSFSLFYFDDYILETAHLLREYNSRLYEICRLH